MTQHLRHAAKAARRSRHPVFPMGCVIVKGGAVISSAANLGPGRGHAEARALRPHQDYRGADAYIVRLNGIGSSMPCPKCSNLLRNSGINSVTYTDRAGVLVRVKAADLVVPQWDV